MGRQIDGSEWTVGIADPNQKLRSIAQMNISERAIATSGNYEKFINIDGKNTPTRSIQKQDCQ